MKKFNRKYFLKHYQSAADKNPLGKINAYLSIINRIGSDLGVRQGRTLLNRSRLLDIGCGYGRFLKAAETNFETYGIDPSEFVINEARKHAQNTKFEVATISSYKSNKKFEVITAFDVLEHTPDIDSAISKINKLLTREGIFVAVVPVYDGFFGKIGGLLDHDPTHIHKLSRWQWLKLFKSRFQIIKTYGAIRCALPGGVYFHLMFPWLFSWGQAILVVMKK